MKKKKKNERITPHTFIIPAFHSHSKISCLNFPAINWDCRVLTGKTRDNVCPTWGKENRDICKSYSLFERSNDFDVSSERAQSVVHAIKHCQKLCTTLYFFVYIISTAMSMKLLHTKTLRYGVPIRCKRWCNRTQDEIFCAQHRKSKRFNCHNLCASISSVDIRCNLVTVRIIAPYIQTFHYQGWTISLSLGVALPRGLWKKKATCDSALAEELPLRK